MSSAPGSTPSTRARIKRLLAILIVFVLVGPPVGAMVFMVTVALVGLKQNVDLQGLVWVAFFAMIYGVPIGYLIGLWPAAAAGLLVGIRQAFFGRIPWWLAVAMGVLVGVGFQVSTGQPVIPADDATVGMREQGPIMIITCLASTMVCWSIVRSWYYAASTAGNTQ